MLISITGTHRTYSAWTTTTHPYTHIVVTYMTLTVVHKLHGRVYPMHIWPINVMQLICWQLISVLITGLLYDDPPPSIAGKLPIKVLVARQLSTHTHTHTHDKWMKEAQLMLWSYTLVRRAIGPFALYVEALWTRVLCVAFVILLLGTRRNSLAVPLVWCQYWHPKSNLDLTKVFGTVNGSVFFPLFATTAQARFLFYS